MIQTLLQQCTAPEADPPSTEMYDIASQLVLKWERFGPHHDIKVTDDFTRLTLDSIAL